MTGECKVRSDQCKVKSAQQVASDFILHFALTTSHFALISFPISNSLPLCRSFVPPYVSTARSTLPLTSVSR